MYRLVILALSVALVLTLSACSNRPQLDLSRIFQSDARPEPVPSALLQRCPQSLPIPADVTRDGEVSPFQLLQMNVEWASQYHYCRGVNDTLVLYLRERQTAAGKK